MKYGFSAGIAAGTLFGVAMALILVPQNSTVHKQVVETVPAKVAPIPMDVREPRVYFDLETGCYYLASYTTNSGLTPRMEAIFSVGGGYGLRQMCRPPKKE